MKGNDVPGTGWSLAVALSFAMVFPTFATWIYFVVLAGNEAMRVTYVLCKVVQFSLPVLWALVVQRRKLQLKNVSFRGIVPGILFGFLAVVTIGAAYLGYFEGSSHLQAMPARLSEKLRDMGAETPLKFLVLAIFISVLHSFLEEYYWRWFVFGELRRLIGLLPAVILSSLAFMSHHVTVINAYLKPEDFWTLTIPFSLAVAVGGAFWAWLYHRSGSLYGPWASHTILDLCIFAVGYDLVWGG